ncbi:hypothetical protein [Micropruina sp.]|uniref:hypothetical protein n=1 Tax=Micropruina sp. TaxID=2737536 RepID=UPI0039E358EE
MTLLRLRGFERQELGVLYFSNGTERILFENGSVWMAIPPDPGAFRSDAFDAIFVDEAGELDPEKAEALQAGYLPTQDTRPDSQTIIAGTPGESRAGLLWSTLEDLRHGVPGVGGVVYEAGDREVFLDVSDPENPVPNIELLLRVHPGISSGLTTAPKVLSRIGKMGLAKWCREYLCQWPLNAGVTALDVAAWVDCATEDAPARPENAAVCWDIDKDGALAALVAAWRDADGRAWLEVLDVRAGYDWIPKAAQAAQGEHRGPVMYDAIGANLDVAEELSRPPYRVRTKPLTTREQVGATARIEKEISRRNVRHLDDPALTGAVESSAWRPAGNARLFLRVAGSCTIVAAAGALWAYDQRSPAAGRRRRIRTSAQVAA